MLDEATADSDPIRQFAAWLEAARAAGIQNAEAIVWFGAATPAKTPRAVVEKLNREINRALALADVKSRLDQLGLEVGGGTPEDFQKFIDKEADRLRKLIADGAVKVE